jgi:hypothetical protein
VAHAVALAESCKSADDERTYNINNERRIVEGASGMSEHKTPDEKSSYRARRSACGDKKNVLEHDTKIRQWAVVRSQQ